MKLSYVNAIKKYVGGCYLPYDSRGEKLKLLDMVLLHDAWYTGLCIVYSDALYFISPSRVHFDCLSSIALKLDITKKEKEYLKENGLNSDIVRGTDVLGRSVKSGDFVYVLSNTMNCGVMVDADTVMTEHMRTMKVNNVLLITEAQMTEAEKTIKNNIQRTMFAKVRVASKEAEVGDLYITKKRLFMYLGAVSMSVTLNGETSWFKTKEPVYYELSSDLEMVAMTQIENRSYINHLFIARLSNEIKYFNAHKGMTLNFDLMQLRCLSKKVRGLSYIGHVGLGRSCIFEENIKYKNNSYNIKVYCKFM